MYDLIDWANAWANVNVSKDADNISSDSIE